MEILTENGLITEVNGNQIKIEIPKKPECEECRSIFCSKSEDKSNYLTIESSEHFSVGDKVEIQLQGNQLFKATLVLFVIPIIILVISILIFQLIITGTVFSSLIGFGLLSIYFLIIRRKRKFNFEPKISKVSS